ncbi:MULTISPECIES: hypothetical protein [Pseudomonas]|uniref:Uncharacterized protein n=1 Tax=Pseudomonas capeferrum TaxID=1495066 RepID=A0ABY7R2H5_9PSED|nr:MULTISPECIES: hypothetical protein [Pseudomonas]KGI92889.1 hypothetical protein MD26_12455 [Pseudomonas sp. H2]MUT49750.1 hypothetical protein [Pseudomonas sp. TDA1]WCH97972.1 hypothetical protein PMC74_14370 [Pseudomonas capeferrum]
MSLQYRKRLKVANGQWLHVACSSLPPTLAVARTGVSALNRRGMEPDEIDTKDLQDLIAHISNERVMLAQELTERKAALVSRSMRAEWLRPLLTLLFMRTTKSRLEQHVQQEVANVEELQAKAHAHGMSFEWAVSRDITERYNAVLKTFSDVLLSEVIWNITSSSPVDQLVERSNSYRSVSRRPVGFERGIPQCLTEQHQAPQQVPLLHNANGEALFLYPGFVLLQGAQGLRIFLVKDLTIGTSIIHFAETDTVPRDSSLTGFRWLRENKDGSPDRRFLSNYQIPEARYGEIQIKGGGLDEEFQTSSAGYGRSFGKSLEALQHAVKWAHQNPTLSTP